MLTPILAIRDSTLSLQNTGSKPTITCSRSHPKWKKSCHKGSLLWGGGGGEWRRWRLWWQLAQQLSSDLNSYDRRLYGSEIKHEDLRVANILSVMASMPIYMYAAIISEANKS